MRKIYRKASGKGYYFYFDKTTGHRKSKAAWNNSRKHSIEYKELYSLFKLPQKLRFAAKVKARGKDVFTANELQDFTEVYDEEYIRLLYSPDTEQRLYNLLKKVVKVGIPQKLVITEIDTGVKEEIKYKFAKKMKLGNANLIVMNDIGVNVDFWGLKGDVKIEIKKW